MPADRASPTPAKSSWRPSSGRSRRAAAGSGCDRPPFLRPYHRSRQRLDSRTCSRQCPGCTTSRRSRLSRGHHCRVNMQHPSRDCLKAAHAIRGPRGWPMRSRRIRRDPPAHVSGRAWSGGEPRPGASEMRKVKRPPRGGRVNVHFLGGTSRRPDQRPTRRRAGRRVGIYAMGARMGWAQTSASACPREWPAERS